jgi:hypothetical protein
MTYQVKKPGSKFAFQVRNLQRYTGAPARAWLTPMVGLYKFANPVDP